jgi:hypothetical protein
MEKNELKNNLVQNDNLNYKPNNFIDMETLINKLKVEDAHNLNMTRAIKWSYICLIIIYVVLTLINIYADTISKISNLCFIISFIIFVIIFSYYQKEYGKIDYSLSSYQLLKKAADRYKLSILRIVIVFLPVLIMDAGITLNFYNEPFGGNTFNRVLIIQAIYIPIMVIACYVGIIIWRKRQKPLADRALIMMKELEG